MSEAWATGDTGEHASQERHEVAEYALLGLLRTGPCHGYRLAAAFAPDGRLGPVLRLKMSQMYAYLHKLERLGWLAAEDVPGTARPRRVFALTPAGESAFDDWLSQPVEATRDVRLSFLVKLAFAIERDPTAAAGLVRRQRDTIRARLARLHAQMADTPGERLDLRELALGHRIHQTAATLAWLEDLANTL